MRKPDWSLVCFTLFSQLSIGIVLCFTVLNFTRHGMALSPGSDMNFNAPVFFALILMIAATSISFAHLGNPVNAPKAINNLSGSWLSREILAISLYSASLVLILVSRPDEGNSESYVYFLWLSSALGLGLLWMMIRIYLVVTIPPWNSWYTPLSFVCTSLCLGLLSMLVFHHAEMLEIDAYFVRLFKISLLIVLMIEIPAGFTHKAWLKQLDSGLDKPQFDKGPFHWVFIMRMAVLIGAYFIMQNLVFQPGFSTESVPVSSMVLLVGLIVTQELAARVMFYSSYFRLGM